MRLAYIISAYRQPAMLHRLVARLDTPGTSFLLHVDRKTDRRTLEEMTARFADMDNLHLLPRHACEWGGFGHVAASLEGIRALTRSGAAYDYAVLLTGQDYPLKSNSQILTWFEQHAGREFLEHEPLPYAGWDGGGMDRIDRWHWRWRGRHMTVRPGPWLPLRRSLPGSLRPFGGSSYWCLTRACVEFVDRWTRQHGDVVRFFRTVDVPDELFFQTVVLNSPFAAATVNDNLRHIEWEDPDQGSPVVLTTAHLPRLLASPKLYARKFDATVDEQVLDALDAAALGSRPG